MSFINSSLNASVHVLRTFVMRLTLQLGYYNLLLPVQLYYATTDGVYGYRKIHYDLKDIGEGCGINRVHRLMKANGLKSQRGYRKPRSYAGTPSVIAANTLARQLV